MQKTAIQWSEFTANPIRARLKAGTNGSGYGSGVGHWCQKISPGCANCYASELQPRFGTPEFDARNADLVEPFLDVVCLEEIRKRKKPALIFLSNMTDLFGDWVPDEWLAQIWKTMAGCPQHTFQLLTKRPRRMHDATLNWEHHRGTLPNVWCGVTVENQKFADERRAMFETVRAAVKFVSYEPALGPVNWSGWEFVNQIISGGESGPNARPSHPDWHRATRDFCGANRIAYFFKQWGEWADCWASGLPLNFKGLESRRINDHGSDITEIEELWCGDENFTDAFVIRAGTKDAGRRLDGREWNELPSTLRPQPSTAS